MTELKRYKVRIKNNDMEVEIESTDKNFVEEKLKEYAVLNSEIKSVNTTSRTHRENNVTLAKLLKDYNATSSQNMKFLGAAVYLSLKGNSSLKTIDINKALRDAGQTRLGNPSRCLAENIKKGYLEKTGSNFVVTMHGSEQFGIYE